MKQPDACSVEGCNEKAVKTQRLTAQIDLAELELSSDRSVIYVNLCETHWEETQKWLADNAKHTSIDTTEWQTGTYQSSVDVKVPMT
jgi:hypothetical protein